MTAKDKFNKICELTAKTLGLPEDSLYNKSRMSKLSRAREIAGMIGLKHGVSRKIISKKFNRNRTLTYYYERHHENKCDKRSGWHEYAKNYYKVLNAYRQNNRNKKVFLDKIMMKNYLRDHNLKNCIKPNLQFIIKTGDVSCVLLSSYSKFSINYDTIKDIFKSYDYTLDWLEL
ncbi:MAG: hypothetical protein Tp1111DCM843611_39 [Prokaryotic dsDNA virus sp.]|nr:MAG: hypothetical protein Tp1111DCM843611_39 [Prokaryotic dsDNA virus sp.]|tara:strand:+ start:2125 stop:2646 length:522 start_codon:yes stop_codon:yes gene_type:complete